MKKYLMSILVFGLALFMGGIVHAEDSSLTIENIQNNPDSIDYTYELHVEGARGAIETTTSEGDEYVVFDALGDVTFKLKGNETITFKGLPVGSTYVLTVDEVKDYTIKINDLEVNKYNGKLDYDSKVTITSFTNKGTGKVDDSKNPKETQKNPSTSDKIVIVSLFCFIAILISYTLLKTKKGKYEGNL